MDIAVAFSVVTCLYYAIFNDPERLVLYLITQFLFIIELIVNFFTEYVDEYGNRVGDLK